MSENEPKYEPTGASHPPLKWDPSVRYSPASARALSLRHYSDFCRAFYAHQAIAQALASMEADNAVLRAAIHAGEWSKVSNLLNTSASRQHDLIQAIAEFKAFGLAPWQIGDPPQRD